jgi:hypothetical protein
MQMRKTVSPVQQSLPDLTSRAMSIVPARHHSADIRTAPFRDTSSN